MAYQYPPKSAFVAKTREEFIWVLEHLSECGYKWALDVPIKPVENMVKMWVRDQYNCLVLDDERHLRRGYISGSNRVYVSSRIKNQFGCDNVLYVQDMMWELNPLLNTALQTAHSTAL